MVKQIFKKSVCVALACFIFVSMVGCGQTVVEESIWVEGDGTTETITHTSGTKNEDSTNNEENANNGSITGNSSGSNNGSSSSKVNSSGNGSSSKVSSSDDKVTTDNSSNKFENTDVEEVQETTDNNYDLKGATVTIAYWGETGGEPNPTSATYSDEVKLIKDIEEKYNCKLAWKNIGDSNSYHASFVTAAQSGVKFADIVQLSTAQSFYQYAKKGYLTKLDDYLDVKEICFNQTARKQLEYNGGTYVVVMSNRWSIPAMIYFNRDVFSKTGVTKTPDKYYASNDWTVDTFLEVARATTKTVNGVNYYGYQLSGASISNWIKVFNGNTVVQKNGKYVFEPDSKNIAAVNFCSSLVWDYGVSNGIADSHTAFQSGNTAMIIGDAWRASTYAESIGASNLGVTSLPRANDAAKYTPAVEETTCFAIPSAAKNPEVLAQIMRDYTYPYKWKESLEDTCAGLGDKTSVNTAVQLTKEAVNNMSLTPNYSYITTKVLWSDRGISQKMGAQAFYDSVAATAQAELDTFWEQK